MSFICSLGIHLAVCSIVYAKKASVEPEEEEENDDTQEASSEEEDDDDLGAGWSEGANESEEPELADDIMTGIKKVSKIVTKFRKSPKLWERLLNRTEEELQERLGLVRQCKTR